MLIILSILVVPRADGHHNLLYPLKPTRYEDTVSSFARLFCPSYGQFLWGCFMGQKGSPSLEVGALLRNPA
jgi:hypothetical protein